MGNKVKSLKDRLKIDKEQSIPVQNLQETTKPVQSSVVKKISKGTEYKSARMSLRVFPEIRDRFTKINRLRGITNNSALNMLMSDYVEKYLYLLDKE